MVLFCLFVVAVFSGVVIALVIRVYDLVMGCLVFGLCLVSLVRFVALWFSACLSCGLVCV